MTDTPTLRELMSPPHMRPVIEWLAAQAGITAILSPTDRDGTIDPFELASMKGQRDLALAFISQCGWTLAFNPPVAPAPVPQAFAEAS